jgi:molecular chaperone GrpE
MPEDETPRVTDRRASSAQSPEEETPMQASTDKSLQEQLADTEDKAQTYLGNWQRAAADFQNYKRRVEQERQDMARLANAALIINMLPMIDDLERALQNVDAQLAGLTWLDGVRLIHRKFQALLEMNGVEEIAADGEQFDPNVHEAVMFGDGEDGKVTGVVQKGYKLGDRIIRPAMVIVGQGAK